MFKHHSQSDHDPGNETLTSHVPAEIVDPERYMSEASNVMSFEHAAKVIRERDSGIEKLAVLGTWQLLPSSSCREKTGEWRFASSDHSLYILMCHTVCWL
jgi:hypothetical protein